VQNIYSSPCKINLGLEVLSKRDDGYHNINTVFHKLHEPHDELIVEGAKAFAFSCDNNEVPTDENNIIAKAMRLCSEDSNINEPQIHIHLKKNIPNAAGLGGGSADAATAIKIFSEHCTYLSQKQQLEIARKLGADVPFFLFHSDTAIATEIGDKLVPLSFQLTKPVLIIKLKDTFVSTAKAYEMLRIKNREKATNFVEVFSSMKEPQQWQNIITNDFEEIAFALHPILFSLKRSLYESGAEFALMSGSGSAFYGIYGTIEQANAAREKLLTEYRGCQVYLSAS
jgi:4-diphosphocytidyl-2-C-methyl-D-erythritol kinase